MMRLSVAIIARDEERHIGAAIESAAALADEIIVLVDQRTRDGTATVAEGHGARVSIEPWRNFSGQRNRALELCQAPWVLFLDADERVSHELAAEIRAVLSRNLGTTEPQNHGTAEPRTKNKEPIAERKNKRTKEQANSAQSMAAENPSLRNTEYGIQDTEYEIPNLQPPISSLQSPAGYWIPRHNMFFGKVVRGGGWYPDHQLRLLRRDAAHYDESRTVHELAELDGESAYLAGHLLHLNIERFDELWQKQSAYAVQEAQTLYLAGRRARLRNLAGAPARELMRRYIRLGGWRDGRLGLLLCGTLAYFEIAKYAHLLRLQWLMNEK
jgi:glycosyltransferase involved in cell wall biosynthesis